MKKFFTLCVVLGWSSCMFAQSFTHRVLIEEETGTGCQNCPYGIAAMEKLVDKFGDKVIPIALHWYNSSDPMYLDTNNYASLTFGAAPRVKIERGQSMHAYDGTNENKGIIADVEPVVNTTVYSGIEVEGVWNTNKTEVTATATIETALSNAMFDVEFVLTADGLTGEGQIWKQKNTFYDFSWSFWFDGDESKRDMERFCQGKQYGQQYFTYPFNHVAIAGCYVNNVNMVDRVIVYNGTPVKSTYTLKMPTSTTLLGAINLDKVNVIAMIIDTQTKKVVNAALYEMKNATEVKDIDIKVDDDESIYNLSGQKVNVSYRGIKIIKGKKCL